VSLRTLRGPVPRRVLAGSAPRRYDEGMGDEKRTAPRVEAVLRIRLDYGSMDDFVERYATNVSSGGIFVRSRDTRPPGTEVGLDVALRSGDQVIRGRGVVRWTTPPSAPGEPPHEPGMGIRFTELTPDSRALVDLVVATQGSVARSEEPPIPDEVDLADVDLGKREPAAAAPAAAPAAATAKPAAAAPAGATAPGPARKPSGPVVGIDLGTTNSCVAYSKDGRATVLRTRQGDTTLPSVVAYDPHGRLLVGAPAKAQMIVNPRHTVYGSKRLVGRPFASPTVQACRDRFHYEIVEAAGGAAAVRFAGRHYSLQQVAALVLKEMKDSASQVLGQPVERAVVTVPAYYNDHQRNAVREAGLLAGLHIERIVNEPTAAALAFGHGKGLDTRVLVYDLGGGTFDASILEIRGDVYEVVSTGGDTFLGGVDFDGQLVDHLVFRFMEEHGIAPPEDRVAWQRIRDAAEETKVALSARERAIAHVPYLCKGPEGQELDLSVEVTRAELEGLTERLVDRTIDVCRDVLGAKGLAPSDVNEVLLVGGQSRMPLVWRKIAAEFGREPNKSVHPDEAVALGAALLAESLARIDSVVLIDALAIGIGVGLPGGRMVPVLPRNTALPAKKAYEIATTHDGQTELEVHVFQGDSHKASECEYLGAVKFPGLPAREKGAVKVSVEFAMGAEGLLVVTGKDSETGRSQVVQLATHDTPESLRAKLGLPEAPSAPRGARPLEPVAAAPPPAAKKKGIFGRLFGSRG
jgi:molecular chaperone DnaK